MKTKFLVPLLALVLFSVTAMAQRTPFLQAGIKAGVNFTKVDGKSFSDEFRYGYHLGGFVQIKLAEKWQLQPEVLFNQYNTRVDTTLSDVIHTENFKNVTLNYLSIPLLLSYSPTKFLSRQVRSLAYCLIKTKIFFKMVKTRLKAATFLYWEACSLTCPTSVSADVIL
jgi:Outer membrane protein beta-barrel domain